MGWSWSVRWSQSSASANRTRPNGRSFDTSLASLLAARMGLEKRYPCLYCFWWSRICCAKSLWGEAPCGSAVYIGSLGLVSPSHFVPPSPFVSLPQTLCPLPQTLSTSQQTLSILSTLLWTLFTPDRLCPPTNWYLYKAEHQEPSRPVCCHSTRDFALQLPWALLLLFSNAIYHFQ